MDFVKAVANVSYNNIFDLEPYENDVELNKLDMMDIAVAVHTQLTGKLITFENEQDDQWTLVMTELGICFTINSKFSALLGVKYGATDSKLTNFITNSIIHISYLYNSSLITILKYSNSNFILK